MSNRTWDVTTPWSCIQRLARLTSRSVFTVSTARPTVRVVVDVAGGEGAYEPGLVVRVRGRTAQNEAVEFFNTSATPVTDGPVQVVLSRIA